MVCFRWQGNLQFLLFVDANSKCFVHGPFDSTLVCGETSYTFEEIENGSFEYAE
jgi:hypothetical protein